MKVTMLSNSKGGVFTATMQWAKGLVRRGCDVNIFFLTQSEEAKGLLPSEHIHFHYFTTSNFLPNLSALVTFLIYDHPDVIHINFAWFGPLAIFKKRMFKTPFIYTLHGLPQPWLEPSLLYKIAYTVEHGLLRFVASQSSVVVVVSNYVKEMLKKRYGVDSEVIYHGIDADKFKPRNKTESKRRLGYKKTDFIILFVGKLHPCKDPLILIRSIYEMVNLNPNMRLVMAGAGELYEELRTEIHRLNLLRYVELLGFVKHEEIRLWYDAADVYVLTSVSEAFGTTLLEAMASGLPVIASKVGACPEIVGNAGILFNQGDHISLARELMTLASDEELSKILRIKSLERVREVFSWDDKIDKYWELYKKAKNLQVKLSMVNFMKCT
jgi:glycosyltransferase involved in cell wall biosynthesis